MSDYRQLNINIDLAEIFEAVKQKHNVEFLATADDLNIKNESDYFGGGKVFHAMPINPPSEVLKLLVTKAEKDINSLILYSSLQGATMLYTFWKDDLIIVKIDF